MIVLERSDTLISNNGKTKLKPVVGPQYAGSSAAETCLLTDWRTQVPFRVIALSS